MESISISDEVIQVADDDDEFDWEAAVKEIDVACEGALAISTSRTGEECFVDPVLQVPQIPSKAKKSGGNTRQSTLERFIKTGDRKSPVENQSLSHKKRLVDANTEGDSNRGEDTVCYTSVDLEAAKTWIYPEFKKKAYALVKPFGIVNVPLRDYQLSITKSALFSNTLVALPTGLGKTLIAAVVMYNYFRWFPEGKIVFTAPSRPLVLQQIEACHNIVGIPQEWTIDMTGQLSPSKRACFWKMKRVFFVTPQVLEKDIQSGTCLVKHLVCLVIDEAHRASGNYSYCVVVRELMAVPVQLRILALTATPGSKQQDIQTVIDNLHISKLEYRNESDHDVSQYVHERKLELMEVPIGKGATEIDKLLMNVIDLYVNRLCSCGVSLDNRDSQTLNPCDYLNYRERFRQAPPLNLSQSRYGEVEGAFGVLITLAHIRKLLLSHGIRPAYDMLEGKWQQGNFARALSRNEVIKKAELLMQQNLSHGAQSPKLSKMIEILTDHFKKNDPKNSRVIIFSNFRDSVRDIMDSLSKFREFVKATEFIGQSSGKTLKGQTQKAQQAVLQKFRAGGYNVIVATSIGEEGLDIMEVDLVICFDANVSPLRMIQRMGRTGRKHDGRVVVLACEGSELKGYKRKQATSKAIRKHMHNGGMSSFDFHTSPRMIPHICRPEVQFVEMLIEQFVPRGRKTKDDPSHIPEFTDKMSDAEIELIAKYFQDSCEDKWKPSLIVFPHFQVFPSRVHKVMHSFRTGMLIDTMQSLQGLSFSNADKTLLAEAKISSCQFMEAETIALDDTVQKDLMRNPDSPKAFSERKITNIEESVMVASSCKEKCSMPHFTSQNPLLHCFLFSADFVSVNVLGMVSITSVPDLPLVKKASSCKRTTENSAVLLDCANPSSVSNKASPGDYSEVLRAQNTGTVTNPAGIRFLNHDLMLRRSRLCNTSDHQEEALHEVEGIVFSTPSPKNDILDSERILEIPAISNILPNVPTSDFKDMGMSPRLTNMVEKGVVPESPVGEIGYCSSPEEYMICQCVGSERGSCGIHPNCNVVQEKEIPVNKILHSEGLVILEGRSVPPVHDSPAKLCTGLPPISSSFVKNEQINMSNSIPVGGYVSYSPINEKTLSPFDKINDSANARGHISGSPVDNRSRTPLANLTNSSCSKDWCLSSGESSKSFQKTHKFKRLRRYRDDITENMCANLSRSFTCIGEDAVKHIKGKKQKTSTIIKNFVEDEAEVSSDAEVSEDEEDKDDDSYNGSFIDDRINPTVATTQAEATGNDMMAVYRRSLFSQSPVESQLNCSTDSSPDSFLPGTKTAVTKSTSGKISHSFQTQEGLESAYQFTIKNKNSQSCQMGAEGTSLLATHGNSEPSREESKTGSRKRKLSFHQGFTATCLQSEQLLQSNGIDKASPLNQCENSRYNEDVFYDDKFFEGLDLDELEAQATKILKCKTDTSIERKQEPPILDSPTFDLGI